MNDHEKIRQLLRIKDQAPITIDPARSALIVVDVQRWFTEPEHPFAQVIEKLVPGATDGYLRSARSDAAGKTGHPACERLELANRRSRGPTARGNGVQQDRSFRVVVAEDACTEMSQEMHQAALLAFGYVFGRVRATEEVINLLTTAGATV